MLLANQARQPERLEECTKLDFLLFRDVLRIVKVVRNRDDTEGHPELREPFLLSNVLTMQQGTALQVVDCRSKRVSGECTFTRVRVVVFEVLARPTLVL